MHNIKNSDYDLEALETIKQHWLVQLQRILSDIELVLTEKGIASTDCQLAYLSGLFTSTERAIDSISFADTWMFEAREHFKIILMGDLEVCREMLGSDEHITKGDDKILIHAQIPPIEDYTTISQSAMFHDVESIGRDKNIYDISEIFKYGFYIGEEDINKFKKEANLGEVQDDRSVCIETTVDDFVGTSDTDATPLKDFIDNLSHAMSKLMRNEILNSENNKQ